MPAELPLPQGRFLEGRVALVTGSAKRLGRTLAESLAALGARVAIHYRSSGEEAMAVVRAIRAAGGEAEAFRADLLDSAECHKLVQQVVQRFGALHVLVNNVGDYLEKNVLELPIADWHYMLDSNLNTTFYMCHFALPELRKGDYGRIINLGFASSGQLISSLNATPYAIAKNGVLTLTKSLATALQAEPITVNMVSPGVLENSITHPPLRDVPRGRWGQPEELAAAIAYLCTPIADYVTGQHLEVAGGWHL
jgi:NAD(P)-dependent dehydrogenase (short-subunit alcohol dehydrogenase family)